MFWLQKKQNAEVEVKPAAFSFKASEPEDNGIVVKNYVPYQM